MTTWTQIIEEIKIEKETAEKIKGLVKTWEAEELSKDAMKIIDTLKYLFDQEDEKLKRLEDGE